MALADIGSTVIDGWVYAERKDVLFCVPKIHYFCTSYREMSLAILFYIYDYLYVSPKDFLDDEARTSQAVEELEPDLKKLSLKQLNFIQQFVIKIFRSKYKYTFNFCFIMVKVVFLFDFYL